MNSGSRARRVALACAFAGVALLQACATTMNTSRYAAQRDRATNRSMVSNYDAFGQPITQHRTVNRTMTVVHERGGVLDFRYY
jgi:hypothetical protein